ncbi:Gp15 family bacteriophage protein [Thomasclavelia cocleata]|uniref:Gp15 family bacteriophage protein n=1 Tax=Thomasclavelia cocleata TaxID=69824 RepID=UPI00256FEB4C|nr:Gp15 family bacteriophage protein [Thomasclavelia cocleata]
MLILDKKDLQKTITINNGTKIPIETDFRAWIKFSCILNDKYIDNIYKPYILFNTVLFSYDTNIEADKILDALLDFYCCNKSIAYSKKPDNKIGFLFDYDMDLIYSAFMQQYRINLLTVDMHWWEFKALLSGLTDNTKFIQVVGYRLADLSKIKDKKERQRLKELQEHYKIKDEKDSFIRTQEEIESDLFERLGIKK